MIDRIGQGQVDILEGPQPKIKITAEWYKSIEDNYKLKLKELEKSS
ncbi:MAG: recombination protein NinG [bacterium]